MSSYYQLEVRLPQNIKYRDLLDFKYLWRFIYTNELKVVKKENTKSTWIFYFNEDNRADITNALTTFKEAVKKNKLWMYK